MADSERSSADELSPSVRRLVKHYDLDITGIHGSGPSGRIRVGDIMPLLGGREAEAGANGAAESDMVSAQVTRVETAAAPLAELAQRRDAARAEQVPSVFGPGADGPIATVVFECDLGRVLKHQKQAEAQSEPIDLAAYFAFACAGALEAEPEINGDPRRVDLGVHTASDSAAVVLRNAGTLSLRDIDRSLRTPAAQSDETAATFSMRCYGDSGSILTFPSMPAPLTHAALGVGKVRKIIAVKTVNGVDAPRITAQCYLNLSFDTNAIGEAQAARFLGECVRIIETYSTAAIESTT
jgi:pyruvate/2-oxoglutarate dehydrogenase complex dihydrolipoamide acyltransferase (E2) component